MNLTEATEVMQLLLYKRYGTFLTLGEVGILRRAEGRRWGAKVHLHLEGGERLCVGIIETDSSGTLTDIFTKGDLVQKIQNAHDKGGSSEEEFGNLFLGDEDAPEEEDPKEIRARIEKLLEEATAESLQRARVLYPLLLKEASTRGAILHEMGLLELVLENNDLALEYLEAATREYANLAKAELIFKVADRVERLLGVEGFEQHVIYKLMKKTVQRMEGLDSLRQVKIFAGLPEEILRELEASAEVIKIDQGEVAIQEGEPATTALIIKQGLLDVVLQSFGEESRPIRACFPGEFLGENSVLFSPGTKLTTASLISSRSNTVCWRFQGERLITLMERIPELALRIHSIKDLHQLDSFFSMHDSMQDLEVKDRDELLQCMTTIKSVEEGVVLAETEVIPENVYLIMRGQVEHQLSSEETVPYGADHFLCMRDALHGIAVEGQYVTTEKSTVVVFDAERLRTFAVNSPPSVVAILERLT